MPLRALEKPISFIQKIPFEIILVVLALATQWFLVTAPMNSLSNWYSTDDAYYYFKTAQNIVLGYGVSFDRIGGASGFHPLWMLVCVAVFAVARQDLILPLRILVVISVLLSAGTAIFIYRILKTMLSGEISALFSLFWIFSMKIQSVNTQLGMESGINAFFSSLLIYLVVRHEIQAGAEKQSLRRLLLIAGAAVLTLFSRLDNIFLVGVVGVWLVLRSTPRLRVLLLGDVAFIASAVFVSFFLRLGFQDNYQPYIEAALAMTLAAVAVRPLVYYFLGLYQNLCDVPSRIVLMRVALATTAASTVLLVMMFLLSRLGVFSGFPRTVIAIEWFYSLVWVAGTRLLARLRAGREPGNGYPLRLGEDWRMAWRERLLRGVAFFAPLAVMLAGYMMWNYINFDTLTPVSGQIKHWWGTLYTVYGRPVDSLQAFFGFPRQIGSGAWGLAFTPQIEVATVWLKAAGSQDETLYNNLVSIFGTLFGAIAVALAVYNWNFVRTALTRLGIIPLFIGSFAQLLYYHGSNYVNTRGWYWVNHTLSVVLVAAVLAECIYRSLLRTRVKPFVLQVIVLVLAALSISRFVTDLRVHIPPQVAAKDQYNYVGGIRALEKLTEPGSLIGSTGGGVIAYYIQERTIVNLDGLMNTREYFELLRTRQAHRYLDQIGLDYVYGNSYMLTESEPYVELFRHRLELIGETGGATLYRYLPGIK